MSSQLYPEIGAHLPAATPTCHFLNYVERADKIVQEPLRIENGFALVPERSGNGLSWDKSCRVPSRLKPSRAHGIGRRAP